MKTLSHATTKKSKIEIQREPLIKRVAFPQEYVSRCDRFHYGKSVTEETNENLVKAQKKLEDALVVK